MSVAPKQPRGAGPSSSGTTANSLAAKVLLAQLYVTWASKPATAELLNGRMQELLATATASGPKGGATANGGHADPNAGLSDADGSSSRRTDSPPATTPTKTTKAGKPRPDDARTPSPVNPAATTAGSNRFLGVDELDYAHRGSSPGGAAPSPHAKAVVDPMAPLPQQPAGAGTGGGGGSPLSGGTAPSPPGAHGTSTPGFDTAVTAAMGDVMPPAMDLSATASGKEPSVGRFVSSMGGYATTAPANVPRASLKDIPVFYTKKDSKGSLDTLPADETQKLAELLRDKKAPGGGTAASSPLSKQQVRKAAYGDLSVQVFKVPIWMKDLLFEANARYVGAAPATAETLTPTQVTKFYNEKLGPLTPSRRLFELIRAPDDKTREFLTIDDLKTIVKYLVAAHPGLEFLQQPEFQDYYCRTVAIRIMYALERQQNRKIYWRDFDRSDLPEVMVELDSKDVNQVLEYFSYEHFYVLYCKFWELDTDRDLLVDFSDLCNYGQGSIVPSVIRRVVDGHGRPLTSGQTGRLDFEDFVYFCLSEEDKNSEPAVYYWFKVLDVDGDGILSGYELMEFYKENQQRFLEYFESPEGDIAYSDTMCQMLDMLGFDRIKTRKFGVTLGDLRACPTPANFFNMIFNAPKFMLFEHRDPFGEHQQKLRPEKTDWDRFARIEYDRMASEAQ